MSFNAGVNYINILTRIYAGVVTLLEFIMCVYLHLTHSIH